MIVLMNFLGVGCATRSYHTLPAAVTTAQPREPTRQPRNSHEAELVSASTSQRNPLLVSQAADEPASKAAKSAINGDLETTAAARTRKIESPAATAFVDDLQRAVRDRIAIEVEPPTVAFGEFRNQSRAASREFRAAIERFATLLQDAADSEAIEFQEFPTVDTPIELRGTVYLLRVGDVDLWEIYPSLHHVDQAGVIWQPNSPVRIPRQQDETQKPMIYPVMTP